MDNASAVTLSRGRSLFRELDTVANNIANAGTTGYRAERVLFTEFVRDLGPQEDSVSLAHSGARFIDLSQGTLVQSGSPLDVAIEGNGFFQVEGGDTPFLTRNGAFTLSPDGELVTSSGRRVFDESGGPIAVPQGTGPITIAGDGTISADGNQIARLGIVDVAPDSLERRGDNLFEAVGESPVPSEAGRVVQGFLENSNVNPISEIARLIEVQRAYETIQRLDQDNDQRLERLMSAINQNG